MELEKAVKKVVNYFKKRPVSISRRYLCKDEYINDIASICDISYHMAEKVAWIVRADGTRDIEAMNIFGYNKHTFE